MKPHEFIAAITFGLLSSAHCIGMCGGFAAMVGTANRPFARIAVRQCAYSAGRVTTYSFLGVLAGFAGLRLQAYGSSLVDVQRVFSILAGVLMLLVGAGMLGLWRVRLFATLGLEKPLAPLLGCFFHTDAKANLFLGGIANGFLPCGPVYAMLAVAVSGGSLIHGGLMMASFGAGTIPAMILVGSGAHLVSAALRVRVYRLAACFVLVAGAATVVRGTRNVDESACCEDAGATAERLELTPAPLTPSFSPP